MLLSCLRGLDVAYILSVCKGKAFGWFPQVFWLFSLPERRFLCFEADLDGFLSQMMCTLELFVPKAHCAAKPDAACCDGRCSALRRLVQRTASSTPCAARKGCRPASMRLFPGFVFFSCGLGRAAKGAGCRLLVVCEAGVCVVRGQKTSSGKVALTAFLPACCFILSGLHACAPGVSAGL